jgi:hypothetical protein
VQVRTRDAGDLAACVQVLTAVHHVDGYPMTRPADPVAWLSPPRTLAAFVAVDDVDVVGRVLLVSDADGSAHVSRLFARRAGAGAASVTVYFAAAVGTSSGLPRLTLEVVEQASEPTGARYPAAAEGDTDPLHASGMQASPSPGMPGRPRTRL